MTNKRNISVDHELIECAVGPDNCDPNLLLFRAPVILDASGYHKRLPHLIDWAHVQVGDALIALSLDQVGSGTKIIDILQFWQVLRKEGEDAFWVAVNNVVGMAGDGRYVYNRIASLVDLPLEE